jgi:flagellar protein FlgJ
MSSAANIPSIFDTQSLVNLKGGLRQDDPKALKEAAKQFEAVFLQMVLKSMRAATLQTGMIDSDQTRFYQELLDSQLAQAMSAKGGVGLAGVIERQLSRPDSVVIPEREGGMPLDPERRPLPLAPLQRNFPLRDDKAPAALPLGNSPVQPATPPISSGGAAPSDFVTQILPHAQAASQSTGIPAHFLVAQAALESGWGKSEPRFSDGRPSHNLFGIKAGNNWRGMAVESVTTEYVNGLPERRTERFRAYNSYAEAFQDYAQLLSASPRYAEVIGSRDPVSFAQGLQRSGYATDPSYGDKLLRVLGSRALTQATTRG